MAHEIESKFKVDDFSAVRRALRAAGAEYLCTVLQTDCYYDTSGKMLLSRDCGLRIRTVRCLRRGAEKIDTRPLLTVKGPADSSLEAKIRREVQTHLDNVEEVEEILLAVGMKPSLTIQKRRASYKLGKSLIELDELPLIGCFVEIEAPSQKQIQQTRQKLHLEGNPITDHYINLLTSANKKIGKSVKCVTFSD